MAAKVGVTFQQLQKYENGINRISASRLHDLAQILDVTIADFFVDLGSKEPGAEDKNALPVQLTKETVALLQSYERLSQEGKAALMLFLKIMSN